MTGGARPPPCRVGGPDEREQIVYKKAAAPAPADLFPCTVGRVLVGKRVAPTVSEVKRRRDMGQISQAAERPKQAGGGESLATARRFSTKQQADRETNQRQANGPANQL